jgi:toxin ParE1/3/4
MHIRWARAAVADLENIGAYLEENNPSLTESTLLKLYEAAQSLKRFSNRGRIGRVVGTRELVVSPLPYIVIYAVAEQVVNIVRVLHAAQDWPGSKREL